MAATMLSTSISRSPSTLSAAGPRKGAGAAAAEDEDEDAEEDEDEAKDEDEVPLPLGAAAAVPSAGRSSRASIPGGASLLLVLSELCF